MTPQEAYESIKQTHRGTHIRDWISKFNVINDASVKLLSTLTWSFMLASLVSTIFGFNALMGFLQGAYQKEVDLGSLIVALLCAWLCGKFDKGLHVVRIDAKFKRAVGEDNINKKYLEVIDAFSKDNT